MRGENMASKIKLMIVEDEWLVREGLKSTIPWDELHCEVAAEADGGAAALQLLEAVRPDIILTDIRMPGMDGLEMAEQAVRLLPGVEIVFLTGFDEFAYAQKALKIGSADYVLKPTNPDELMQVIGKVGDKVRKRKTSVNAELFMQTRYKDSGTLLASKLLYDLLMDSAGDKERELFVELWGGRPSALAAYRVGLFELELRDRPQDERKKLLLQAEALLFDADVSFVRVQDRFAMLIGEVDAERAWPGLASRLTESLDGAPTVVAGWSGVHAAIEELSVAYEEAENALTAQSGGTAAALPRLTELPSIDTMKSELRNTIAYIEGHFHEDISLHDIAGSVHMSESNFSRLFKKQTGVSFVEYVTQLRMEKAKEMLQRPDEKIYEVALAVGYQDSRYFSQIFRKYTGDTPSEFRKRLGFG